jgi:hypothetical protein
MGHDISAYIKTKSSPTDDSFYASKNEVAYFRIGAFNTSRQRLFYGILPNSTTANAGVSGDGSTLDFTEDDIKLGISACKYFMDDDSALREHLLEQKMEAEDSIKAFVEVFQQIAPDIKKLTTKEDISIEDARENIADIWKFHEDILSAYNDVKNTDDSARIEIYFG